MIIVVYVWEYACVMVHKWRSEDNLLETILTCHHVGHWAGTEAVDLDKCLPAEPLLGLLCLVLALCELVTLLSLW